MPASPELVRFGVFELDLNSGELRRNGRKLKLQEQPFRVLNLLLQEPGQAVARDKLKESLWPADTFVDFDHSLNAAIAKLRQALGDSAENPRFIETLARRGYRFIAPVEFVGSSNGNAVQPDITPNGAHRENGAERGFATIAVAVPAKKRIGFVVAVSAAAVLALLLLVLWERQTKQTANTELVKLTDGTGLTADPAISDDGKLIAYASDRGSHGNLNIWIQQLGPGGGAVQLTHDDVDADEAAFSPDGTRIAFRSKKNGGGIYLIPVIGGEASRLTQSGRSPRFSPDGQWIAYWSGGSDAVVPTVRGAGAVYIVASAGGEPKRLGLDLSTAGNPVWSPDGKHLLVYVSPKTGYAWDTADWWLVALDGSPSQRTDNFSTLKSQGFSLGFDRIPRLSQWSRDFITFSAGFGDAVNAWRAPVSADGHISGPAERLTSGTTLEISPTLSANGELLFASLNRNTAVWSLPADPDQAKVQGEPKKITEGVTEVLPSISADGRKLAFTAAYARDHSGIGGVGFGPVASIREPITLPQEAAQLQTRVRDLDTGKEAAVSSGTIPQWHPQLSRDGTMVAYTSGKPGQLYAAPVSGGSPRMILGGANKMIWDWSLDNSRLLFGSTDDDDQVHSLDLKSGREKLFLNKPGISLFQAKFSPDDQWIAVEGVQGADEGRWQSQILLVPVENGSAAPPDHWIAIDHHPNGWDDKPRWSPNGNLIYFISDRDGYLCLWAQRLESRGKKLVGSPFPVYHFHNARLSMANLDTGILEIGVAKDKIIVGLGELTGNIWSMRRTSK
jgi:Tol biopolymer transport system component/DNA-binding winged helix-turn-helix (wHTH) protein